MLDECAVNSFRDSSRSAQTVAEHIYGSLLLRTDCQFGTGRVLLRKTEKLLKYAESSYINCEKGITFSRIIFLLLISRTISPGILFI